LGIVLFRTPEYFWFDPHGFEFEGFQLMNGTYEAIAPTEQGWRWSQQLGLYLGIHHDQLRYFTAEGEIVPTPEESAEAERERADAATQQVDAERQRADAERTRRSRRHIMGFLCQEIQSRMRSLYRFNLFDQSLH
jgi:hypothetical protein